MKLKILIVSSDFVIISLLKKILLLNFDIKKISNYSTYVELYNDSKYRFDIIITDETAHGVSGLEIINHILNSKSKKTNIIFLTNISSEGKRALKLGASSSVMKPIVIDKLLSALRQNKVG